VSTVSHPDLGFALDLPPGFEVVGVDGVPLAARTAEPDPGGFHANLNVVAEQLPGDGDLERFVEDSLEQHVETLPAFRVIDREETTVAGVPAVRTLAHHAAGGRALVLEQWRLARGDRAFTVSTTCPALDWPAAAGTLADAAETLRFAGDAG
jgi:hypothetical protein